MGKWGKGVRRRPGSRRGWEVMVGDRKTRSADASDARAGVSVRSPTIVAVALDGLGRRPRDV